MRFAITRLVPSVVAAAGLLIFVFASAARHKTDSPQTAARVTFSRDIAPIVFSLLRSVPPLRRSGPFPLVTYGDAKSPCAPDCRHHQQAFDAPWLPAAEGLAFEEDSHLSEQQITLSGNGPPVAWPREIAPSFRPRQNSALAGSLGNRTLF